MHTLAERCVLQHQRRWLGRRHGYTARDIRPYRPPDTVSSGGGGGGGGGAAGADAAWLDKL